MTTIVLVFLYFGVVIFPLAFWFWFFRRQDKLEPESRKLLMKIFELGAISIVFALIFEFVLDYIFEFFGVTSEQLEPGILLSGGAFFLVAFSFFLVGPVEELVKFLVLKFYVFKKLDFNQIIDGVVYGATLALGFAFIENSEYFLNAYQNIDVPWVFVMVVTFRGVITALVHVVSTGIIGLFIGRAKFSDSKNQKKIMFKGFLIASLIHGCYNVLIFFSFWGIVASSFLVIISMWWLVHEIKKPESKIIWEKREKDLEKLSE